ncbi:DoxX family protein [Mesorhizobium sp. IRAMC:0171]|uniref:DoxX family protein n=2 Tax=Mesorhizobium retamae TaxID=2912854 RepID=A0ABS9QLR6_9HYPH|nr:DoxX family protein [Mesorhizobium sp. IRAMC:0171]
MMFVDFHEEILFVGRLLLGGAFIFAGLRNIQNRSFVAQLMSTRGVPQAPTVLWLGIVVQGIAGALLIAGICTAASAALLLLFLIVATPMFHNFWDYQPGPDRVAKINGFVGNVALAGAILTLIANSLQA